MATLAGRSSTHNFINTDIAKGLGLQAKPISPFKVKVRIGKILVCDRFYKVVPIDIQGVQFDVDLYELPDCGTEVVLGMQWFRQLRYAWIYWDKSFVSFMNEEVEVKLQGSPMKRVEDFGRAHREQDWWNHQGNSVKTTSPATMAAKEDFNREAVADEKLAPVPPPATIAEDDVAFSCHKPEVPAALSFAIHGLVDAVSHIKDVAAIRLEGGRRFLRGKNEKTEVGGVKGFVHVPEPNWKRRKRTVPIFELVGNAAGDNKATESGRGRVGGDKDGVIGEGEEGSMETEMGELAKEVSDGINCGAEFRVAVAMGGGRFAVVMGKMKVSDGSIVAEESTS
ncbi:unnamed protein product [Linum tenue]|uniref:Uncharacterized protein n=1 Tax=Linum tenue TaxID=586396 RepID=A0AAV0GX25_9ROSI|nr:unnamed protein product [Linum tenue]